MFPKFYMTVDAKAMRYEIIAAKILLRDTIAKKTIHPRLWFEFVSFMGRKKDKANTTEYLKIGIIWEFVIK